MVRRFGFELFDFFTPSVLPVDTLQSFTADLRDKLLFKKGFDNFGIRLENWSLEDVDFLN